MTKNATSIVYITCCLIIDTDTHTTAVHNKYTVIQFFMT